ncbi:MAG: hypothetical protein JSW51_05570 [Gemmatimonadota bacterium]|nr:MAG: hypothetical protein JSW51_05570 [Gemmatimonadota bacterium]
MRCILAPALLWACTFTGTFTTPSLPTLDASPLGCAVSIKARWTGIPQGYRGVIRMKWSSSMKSRVKIKGGSWSPLSGASLHSVQFYPGGRYKDEYMWNGRSGWTVMSQGQGTWSMRADLRMGCNYRRQYQFYVDVVSEELLKAVDGAQIHFPARGEFTAKGTTTIDLGDLGRYNWAYRID